MPAENVTEESGWQFVVLLVGLAGNRGDVAGAHTRGERGPIVAVELLRRPLAAQLANARANGKVGHKTVLGHADGGTEQSIVHHAAAFPFFGRQGKKALVVR